MKAGQSVMVITSSEGFNASGEGKALNSPILILAQSVRVRMGNGQVVSGKVDADGNIRISL